MSAHDTSDRTCNICGEELQIYRPRDVLGCSNCETAWPEERVDDWADPNSMPDVELDYSEFFGTPD